MDSESEEWRTAYWDKFRETFNMKSPEWAHESEYRIVLYSMLDPQKEKYQRTLKYRFSDLVGIAFGVKTSAVDHLRVMQIVREKCAVEGRTDFKFFQADYSHVAKKIVLSPKLSAARAVTGIV